MPHLVLRGTVDAARVVADLDPRVVKWRRAVLKIGDRWCRADGAAVLVDGVVVELGRPLHPVAVVAARNCDTVLRLWPVVEVERTPAVQRWLAVIACGLQRLGAGPVRTTNISHELLDDLDLELG